MYVQVIISKTSPYIDRSYTYLCPEEMISMVEIGKQVIVPYGKRKAIGYIVALNSKIPEGVSNIKELFEIRNGLPFFSIENVDLAKWMSQYYVCSFAIALKAMFPPGKETYEKLTGKKRYGEKIEKEDSVISLAGKEGQNSIVDKIVQNKHGKYLLKGFNKEDKISVYSDIIRKCLSSDKGTIILLPEISPTNPVVNMLVKEYGSRVSMIHSELSEKEKNKNWKKILSGQSRIVVGTRNVLFAPVTDLGAIIMDQEEGYAYKQEQTPKYHAREVAMQIALEKKIPVILESSTPMIETYQKCMTGEITLIENEKTQIPDVDAIKIVDMSENGYVLSNELISSINEALSKKQKTVLLMNRRGYSPFLVCNDCGKIIECPNCSVSLVYNQQEKSLHCKRCGFSRDTSITCPNCHGAYIRFLGTGVQKVESELKKNFKGAKIKRIDKDNAKSKSDVSDAIKGFIEGDTDILIGTQIVSKALEADSIPLVGILSADTALNSADFRSGEYTMQFLSGIFGFSGNNIRPEKIIVQTANPKHYAIENAVSNDYKKFYQVEMANREKTSDTPFSKMISINVFGDNTGSYEGGKWVRAQLEKIKNDDVIILGPAQIGVNKTNNVYKWQLLIKGKNLDIIKSKLKDMVFVDKSRKVRIVVDVDPISII